MWAWLAIPWVRKIGEIALFLLALAAVAYAIYHAGQHAGERAEAGRQVETAKAQYEQIRTQFQTALDAGRAREEQLGQLATKFADLAASAATHVDMARAASIADAAKVKALPDSAVKADLEAKAGGPLENPAVLRHVDDVFTDYPHQLDIVKGQIDGLAALNSSLTTAQSQTQNADAERDAAIGAFNQLVPLYAQAYNAAIGGHRRWYCLFLCKPKNRLSLPAPISIAETLKKGIAK